MSRAVRAIPTAVALALLAPAAGSAAPAEVVRSTLSLSPGRIDRERATIAGWPRERTPGRPALPYRDLWLALHPRVDLASLRVVLRSGVTELLGHRQLPPNPRLLAFDPRGRRWRDVDDKLRLLASRPSAPRARAAPHPAVIERRGVSRRGPLTLLRLRYRPLRYRGSGELRVERRTRVEVRYRLRRAGGEGLPAATPRLLRALARAENAAQARRWFAAASALPPVGYAIVIPDSLSQRSTALATFIAHKEALGMQVHVVGDAELAAIPIGPGGGDPERIRGWLQRNYQRRSLRYVLLVGNPDPSMPGVPMKLTYPLTGSVLSSSNAPTDHYYADLTGNWDLDGDGRAAEFPADRGDEGVDFVPEVYVGRIPVYDDNIAALDAILRKTIAYATDRGDRAWRRRVLQPAAMLFFERQYGQSTVRIDGADVADAIYQQVIQARETPHTSLYEAEGIDPSRIDSDLPLTSDNVVDRWRQGYGLVNLVGHGSASSIFRLVWHRDDGNEIPDHGEVSAPPFLTYDDAARLDDRRPAMVFHASCANATPERPDNLAYGLLRRGAVGTISSTRVVLVVLATGTSASQNIFGISRELVRRLLDGAPIGEALFEAKLDIGEDLGQLAWFTRLEINLYGDPSLTLTNCAGDADCDDGDRCTGAERCRAGQCEPGTPVLCQAADPCVEARCDGASGACVTADRPEGEPCDDQRFCTVDDRCHAGRCVGQPRCAAPRNPCVRAICDERGGTCDVYVPIEEGERICHAGTDRQGTCRAGVCVPDAGGCVVGRGDAAPALAWLVLLGAALAAARRRRDGSD